jgi:hypothetical protein
MTNFLIYTYEVEDAVWGSLLTGLLAEVQQTLSSVCGPGSILVSGILLLLTTEIAGESLVLDWLGAEPEKLLLKDQTPI